MKLCKKCGKEIIIPQDQWSEMAKGFRTADLALRGRIHCFSCKPYCPKHSLRKPRHCKECGEVDESQFSISATRCNKCWYKIHTQQQKIRRANGTLTPRKRKIKYPKEFFETKKDGIKGRESAIWRENRILSNIDVVDYILELNEEKINKRIQDSQCVLCGRVFKRTTQGGASRLCCYECITHGSLKAALLSNNRTITREIIAIHKEAIGCAKCEYNTYAGALDWHHPDKNKEKNVCQCFSLAPYFRESSKCILLCVRCHRELHAKVWQLSDLKNL